MALVQYLMKSATKRYCGSGVISHEIWKYEILWSFWNIPFNLKLWDIVKFQLDQSDHTDQSGYTSASSDRFRSCLLQNVNTLRWNKIQPKLSLENLFSVYTSNVGQKYLSEGLKKHRILVCVHIKHFCQFPRVILVLNISWGQ